MGGRSFLAQGQLPNGDRVRQYLRGHSLFGELADDLISRLAGSAVEREYPRGHHLYYSGDPLTYIIVIRSGLVAMTEFDRQGNRQTPLTFGSGHVLGLVTATLQQRWTWTSVAITDTRTFLLPLDTFQLVYNSSLEFSHQVAAELSRMVLRSEKATVRLRHAPIVSRVAAFLIEYADSSVRLQVHPSTFDLLLSHQDIALLLGTSRESVTRALSALSRSQLILVRGQSICMLQLEQLQCLAEG